MKVYTKRGDDGDTGLLGGQRVRKDHIRVEAYGTVDELNSSIGFLRDSIAWSHQREILLKIQNVLFEVGSSIATSETSSKDFNGLGTEPVAVLENAIDKMEEDLPRLKHFIIPGGHPVVSFCHICRTVCRRCERRVVSLADVSEIDPTIVPLLNRLSDFLFVLARFIAHQHGATEIKWE